MDVDGAIGIPSEPKTEFVLPLTVQENTKAKRIHSASVEQKTNVKEVRMYPSFTKDQLKDLIDEANKVLNPESTEMHYVFHEKLKEYYIRLENPMTHQVIREIPPKKFMDMYAAIAEKLGLIVNKRI